jgi:hypothetical protein
VVGSDAIAIASWAAFAVGVREGSGVRVSVGNRLRITISSGSDPKEAQARLTIIKPAQAR